jgi:hypothetical protein
MNPYPPPGRCPVCNGDLAVTRLDCANCETRIEGRFDGGRLGRLDRDQLAFVEVFLRNRGVIKDVEVDLGLSYPTIRARLDEVVRALGYGGDERRPSRTETVSRRERRRQILQDLRDRVVAPEEAARRLAAIDGDTGDEDRTPMPATNGKEATR